MIYDIGDDPKTVREFHLQVRLNDYELNMLDQLCAAYGLERTDVIRRLIRDDWYTFQSPRE